MIHYTTKKIVSKNFVWAQAHKLHNMHPSLHRAIQGLNIYLSGSVFYVFDIKSVDLSVSEFYDGHKWRKYIVNLL